jgi:hypothetical protein
MVVLKTTALAAGSGQLATPRRRVHCGLRAVAKQLHNGHLRCKVTAGNRVTRRELLQRGY